MSFTVVPFPSLPPCIGAKQETHPVLLSRGNTYMFCAKIPLPTMRKSSPYDGMGSRRHFCTTTRKSVRVLMPVRMGAGQSIALLQEHPSAFASKQEGYGQLATRINDGGAEDNEEIPLLYAEEFSEVRHSERALERQGYPYGGGFCWEMILASVSLGIALWFLDSDQQALAFWPEGPLVEEFWENMRRYGLYVLTVGTGALYTVLKPIAELLRSPISAVLVIAIISGFFYVLYLTLNAMFGISDFAYLYAS